MNPMGKGTGAWCHTYVERTVMPKIALLTSLLFTMLISYCNPGACLAEDHIMHVSTSELKQMMDDGDNLTLVNVLPKIMYDAMHLPGSINYPIGRLASAEGLPFPKDQPLVFYCMGVL
jgi:hypothetical protein